MIHRNNNTGDTMFSRHLIVKNEDNEEILYLFINTNFEFSKEFSNKNEDSKKDSLLEHAKDYITKRRIKFNGKKIFIVVSGIVIGALSLAKLNNTKLDVALTPKPKYMVSLEKLNEINIPLKNNVEIIIPNIETKDEVKETIEIPKQNNVKVPITQTPKTNMPPPVQNPNPSLPTPTVPEPPPPVIEEPKLENPVNIHMVNGIIQTISFEDFIIGVVAAEMPASFHSEALKAQSVATRTYYLKAINQGKRLTQINSGQITYKTIDDLKSLWGSNFNTYYTKIKNAVNSTKGEFIAYNGSYIEAVYCSTNNGKTSSSVDVWGNYYPYLISVDSPWDINASSYLREIDKDLSLVSSILGINIYENTPIQVIDRTDNDSIRNIMIGDKTFTGLYIRSALGLRSTDFDLKVIGNNIHITTRGYGHGVGMSQYGANGMANAGYSYRQILSHYYPGTSIQK